MSDNTNTVNTKETEEVEEALLSEQDLLININEALEMPMPKLNDNKDDSYESNQDFNEKMVEREYSSEEKKKLHILIIMLIFITIVILLGFGYYQSITSMILDMINDNIKPANVEIRSVPGSNGGNDLICDNKNGIYIYTDGAIIDINTNEIIIKADNITNIACSDKVLVYSTQDKLYRYIFEAEQTYEAGEFNVVSMKGNSEDIFVTIESGKSGINQQHVHNVLYFHSVDAGINLDKLIDMNSDTVIFNGYTILINRILIQICYITDGEFEYTCGLDIHGLNSHGICRITENFDYIFPNYDARRQLTVITGGTEYTKGIYPSHVGFIDNTIYIVEQYNRNKIEHIENVKALYKDYDAYFSVDTASGDCKLLYKCKPNEQIVNFATSGTEIYILRDNDMYVHNIITGQEDYVFCNKGYDTLLFETVDDTMYIFEKDNYSDKIHYITRMKIGKHRYE